MRPCAKRNEKKRSPKSPRSRNARKRAKSKKINNETSTPLRAGSTPRCFRSSRDFLFLLLSFSHSPLGFRGTHFLGPQTSKEVAYSSRLSVQKPAASISEVNSFSNVRVRKTSPSWFVCGMFKTFRTRRLVCVCFLLLSKDRTFNFSLFLS